MTVEEFLSLFRTDIDACPTVNDPYEDHLAWHAKFFKKTLAFHHSAKKSYFEAMNKRIDENHYYPGDEALGTFAYLGLFIDDDEAEFVAIIRKLIAKLDETHEETAMEDILSFLWWLTDFLVHEYYPNEGSELEHVLVELKIKILETQNYDKEQTGYQVVRFIDLMIPAQYRSKRGQ